MVLAVEPLVGVLATGVMGVSVLILWVAFFGRPDPRDAAAVIGYRRRHGAHRHGVARRVIPVGLAGKSRKGEGIDCPPTEGA